jgi:hypothetical protein
VGAIPEPVRLDDLAAPRFSDEVAALLAAGAELAPHLDLSVDGILAAARAATGLDHVGDPSFLEPLGVLVDAFAGEAGLSRFGVVSIHTQLVQLASNRLRIEDLIGRHPEILDIEIAAPIVIAGLPRTGTTHLHNLLAADPALRSLPYWESVEPVPVPGERPGPDGRDPRIVRTQGAVDFLDAALPHLRRMHEMTVDHVHEEIQLLAIDFSTMYFDALAPIPTWRAWYLAHDQTDHYRYLRRVLQALTFLGGDQGRRWVLKSPQHLEQFAALSTVFPDATVIVTHRDPVDVTVSMATMVAYTARLQQEHVDPTAIGRCWSTLVEQLLDACVRDRDLLDPGRSMDVRFDDFMADDLATVAAIYELAGQPLDDRARDGHAEYLASHQRDRHGRVVRDPAAVGIDVEERRAALRGYAARFGVER